MSCSKTKLFSLLAALFLVTLLAVFLVSAYSQQISKREMNPYQKLAYESDLIVLGRVNFIEKKRGVFGFVGEDPYYVTYQYITLDVERLIKGTPKGTPVVFRSLENSLHSPKFVEGEQVIVMLKWYEDDFYGKYYALTTSSSDGIGRASKFMIKENVVTNKFLTRNEIKVDLESFINDISQ